MSKDKNKKPAKISEIDQKIAEWEEKLSLAEINKNKQEIAALKRMIDFYKKKREGGSPLQ